ncbi:response regulator [Hirschia maritima]|uniref:response regulator n=1 Tax=Hirschia maritima TaxID=1121961 RepID=UPI000362DD3E|nr:response regulator [Hirschia maritima]
MAKRNLDRIRVLIVDDNLHMIFIVKTLLRGFGLKDFLEARDAVEAFEIANSEPIDLIIVDYEMDILDGADFIRLVRNGNDSQNPYIPIIMLTAYSERSKVEAARDAGVTEFLAKPVNAIDLYKKIASIINSPRPFIRTSNYFGPDRRRHVSMDFRGEDKRERPDMDQDLDLNF